MEKIIRQFKVKRGEKEIIYPFTTFSCVFDAEKLPASPNRTLQEYLREIFMSGVPSGERNSVSDLSQLIVETVKQESDLVELARKANYRGLRNKQHECVQNYLMDNDPHTIAMEIPVWDMFTLGHIDHIRITGEKIGVWDFKPLAHKETKAGGQVLRYISMLTKQLDLPLRLFEGGYYDDSNCYLIKLYNYA